MNTIQIGNAPCSWGSLEFEGLEGESIGYDQMLNELRDTGYVGSELGDLGYMPSEPDALRAEFSQRKLTLTGGFVPVALKYSEAYAEGEAQVLKVARLLAAAGTQPFLVLADANGTEPDRTRMAGRVSADQGLSPSEWRTFAAHAERIAYVVREETGLRTVFHHHCAGYVETPIEIAHLLDRTDPSLLGLVFDTGHYVYGSGQNDGSAIQAGLESFADRIWYVHFKDCQPQIAAEARANGWDYFTAVGKGVFCELGQGCVDFAAVVDWLRARNYSGWITVEQDVLPGMGVPRASAQRNREFLAGLGL